MSELDRLIDSYVEHGVLSAAQADELRAAAVPTPSQQRSTGGVLDVLGYVGGTLLLAAIVFVVSMLWSDIGRTGRVLISIASLLVPAAAGVLLLISRSRRTLGVVLLAVACVAAVFAWYVIAEQEKLTLPPSWC